MKISPVITKPVKRYFCKNTINAKHNRNIDTALLSGIATSAQLLRFPTWNFADAPITAVLATIFIKNSIQSFTKLKEIQTLKKRAINIKKHSNK